MSHASPKATLCPAITPRSVLPAAATPTTRDSRSAGSTTAAIATSRAAPIPPNAEPASRAPSASAKRVSASIPMTTNRSPNDPSGARTPTSGTRSTRNTMTASTTGGTMLESGLAASLSTGCLRHHLARSR